MLYSREIPQYESDPQNWHRFIEKVSKGSSKAHNILSNASMAYMVELTGDPTSPSTVNLDDYKKIFHSSFPPSPVKSSIDELVQIAIANHWFPYPFIPINHQRNNSAHYCKLWTRSQTVDWKDLVNDALISCLNSWSADNCLIWMNEDPCNYDSRIVLSGMFYLALTWPENHHRLQNYVEAD